MTKERVIDQYGSRALHDRQRLLRRLADPAAGRQRLPRPLPGHHARPAASRTRGRRRCSTSTTRPCAATTRTRRAGRRASPGTPDVDRRGRGPRQPGQRGHLHRRDPVERRPEPRLPRRAARPGLRRADEPEGRALLVPRLHGQRLRPAARRTGSRAGRPTTSASSTGARRSERAGSRPAQFVDVNAKIGAVRHRLQPDQGARRGRPSGARARLPQRRGQPGRQPRPGRDHRPARARPGRLPRRLPDGHDARAAGARARHRGQPDPLARPGADRRRHDLHRRVDHRDGRVARGDREGRAQRPARRRRSSRTSRRRSSSAAPTATATSSPRPTCDATVTSYSDPRLEAGMPRAGRHDQVRAEAACAAPTTRPRSSPTRSGSSSRRRSRAASATTRSPASTASRRRSGRPTRSATAR